MDNLTAAQTVTIAGFHTDLPLFIQGCVMITLATVPMLIALLTRNKREQQSDDHEQHMAELIVKAMREEHADDTKQEEVDK